MYKLVFLSQGATDFFQIYGPPSQEWFINLSGEFLSLPSFVNGNGDVIVLGPDEMNRLDRAVVSILATQGNGFLPEINSKRRPEAFNRILRLIQSTLDQSISIPSLWKPFNADSLIAIQTNSRASGESARLLFDRRIHGSVFGTCYGIIPKEIDFLKNSPTLLADQELQARFR